MPSAVPTAYFAARDETSKFAVSPLPTREQRETAQLLADRVLELRNMARALKLYSISAPLESAYYEAFSTANRAVVPRFESDRK